MVCINGWIIDAPPEDLHDSKKMQWWKAIDSFGDDPAVEKFCRVASNQYFGIKAPSFITRITVQYKTARRRFLWDHPAILGHVYKLRRFGIKL